MIQYFLSLDPVNMFLFCFLILMIGFLIVLFTIEITDYSFGAWEVRQGVVEYKFCDKEYCEIFFKRLDSYEVAHHEKIICSFPEYYEIQTGNLVIYKVRLDRKGKHIYKTKIIRWN